MRETADVLHLLVLLKLLLATVLGGTIGIEREIARKPAGLRTNILICVGSALFTALAMEFAGPAGDPSRIIAQILTGIGFLGAGAILHGGTAVVGLTTAATIWVVAAVGVAVGGGFWVDAVGSTALIIIVLTGLRPLERKLAAKRRRLHVLIRVKAGCPFEPVSKVIESAGIHIYESRTYEHGTDRAFEMDLIGAGMQFDSAVDQLRQMPQVVSVTTE